MADRLNVQSRLTGSAFNITTHSQKTTPRLTIIFTLDTARLTQTSFSHHLLSLDLLRESVIPRHLTRCIITNISFRRTYQPLSHQAKRPKGADAFALPSRFYAISFSLPFDSDRSGSDKSDTSNLASLAPRQPYYTTPALKTGGRYGGMLNMQPLDAGFRA